MLAPEFDSVILLDLLKQRDYTVEELYKGFEWTIEELAYVIVYLNLQGNNIRIFQQNVMEGAVSIGLET